MTTITVSDLQFVEALSYPPLEKIQGGNYLTDLALSLGRRLDAQAETVSQQSMMVAPQDSNQDLIRFQQESQRMSLLLQTANNSIRSIGEAMAAAARRA